MRFSTSARKIVQELYNNLVCVWKLLFPVALCNQSRASLITSTIIRAITKRVGVSPDSVTSICKYDLGIPERNIFDDNLLIVWTSSSSDLSLYKQFKRDTDNEDLSIMSRDRPGFLEKSRSRPKSAYFVPFPVQPGSS